MAAITVLLYSFSIPLEVRAQNVPNVLICIAQKESGVRQFDKNGEPLESPTHDWGVFQINEGWLPTATKMGLDVKYNEEDNITFALWLADKYGLSQWATYKYCKGVDDS